MRYAALLLTLALAACGENLPHTQPPMDRFFYPSGVALTPVAGGNQALLVASANFDLHYDQQVGGTLLSVDPSLALGAAGGSLGRGGGALVKFGPGAQLGAYAGPVALLDAGNCPGWTSGVAGSSSVAFVASRYTNQLYRFPVGDDGSVTPCLDGPCQFALDPNLADPAALGLACHANGLRRSLFVGFLRAPALDIYTAGTAWLSEFDLDDLTLPSRTFALSPGPAGDMAYDALTDRLYVVGRYAGLTAPLNVLDLKPCYASSTTTCAAGIQTVDLYGNLHGAELVGIALSNPQVGRVRRAYLSVRVYDEGYASAVRARPGFDVGGAIMVVDLDEDLLGQPAPRFVAAIPIGLGAGAVKVLPVRPGLGDLVVVPSTDDGTIQVYDDEVGAVVRVVAVDPYSGAPEAGHLPSAMAVDDRGTEALVYIASFGDWTVSVLRVPLANPTEADLVRDPTTGKPLRIGSPKP